MILSRLQYSRLALLLVLVTGILAPGWAAPAPARQQDAGELFVGRIRTKSTEERMQLSSLGLDLLELREGDELFAIMTAAQAQRLRDEGWQIAVDEEQTAMLRQQPTRAFYGGYRSIAEMRAALEEAEARYPHLAEVFVYGRSWEGRDLVGISLTNKLRPGPKPTFFLMAGIHARELATPELALRLVDHLLDGYGSDGDVTWLLDEHTIIVVPGANPDGHLKVAEGDSPYMQRKNRNTSQGNCAEPPDDWNQYGVDLNRNSSFKWGGASTSSNPCSLVFKGASMASEPETQALQSLITSLFPDQRGPADSDAAPADATGILISLHSFSDMVLYPWGWTDSPAPNGGDLALIGHKLASYNGYRAGQPGEILYNASGTTDDWSYGELGIASFTFEVGPQSGTCAGFMPPYSCIDGDGGGRAFWPENRPALLYAARIARAPYLLIHGPTPESLTATVIASNTVELLAVFDEQYNGGQPITAAEYYVDIPPWRGSVAGSMAPADGSFSSLNESAVAVIGPIPGRHLIYARGQDAAGNWGPVRAVLVNVPGSSAIWLPLAAR
ncbi:MAG: hypothetical protein KatS3mg057_2856 [Herpetosiphonaceae bacterium]|nr:MAG: hypothetical protein KatS3mg057_2856 [Herpetosiphonaceae bacterium]